jgi:hypothetical protein
VDRYLSFTEKVVVRHKIARIRAEVEWHEKLYSHLPEIIADESARKET